MFEQTQLSEQFQALLNAQEKTARQCLQAAGQTSDPHLKEEIQQLHREKQRHMELTERLLEIVE